MRARLEHELRLREEPPLADLVPHALQEGRRRYRRRRLSEGAAVVGAVMAVAAVMLVVPGLLGGGSGAEVAALPADGPTATSPTQTPSPSAPPATAARVAASPAGLLLQVIDRLKSVGVTGDAEGAVADDGSLFVQVTVTGPRGPGMFRLQAAQGLEVPTGTSSPDQTRTVLDDGSVVVTGGIADNCIQHQYVTAYRPDGTSVYVGNASCLAWNGTTNPPATPLLTLEQAIALAVDPAVATTIAADVEAAGEATLAHVPTFN
jgi:hypothetical protein